MSSIAKLYGVSTSDVVRWNNLENGDAIRPGDRLRVTSLRPTVELDGQGVVEFVLACGATDAESSAKKRPNGVLHEADQLLELDYGFVGRRQRL